MLANLIGAAIVAIHIGRNEDYARSNCASAGVQMLLISGDPQRRESYFFKSDLLGFVLVWHVLHGWPFPIAGVASAFGAGKEIIARASKNCGSYYPAHNPQRDRSYRWHGRTPKFRAL